MLSIGKQSLKDLNTFLNKNHFSKIGIIVDENSQKFCLPILQSSIVSRQSSILTIPSGEHHKNLTTCENIWRQLTDLYFDRRSLIINLGGGVIGDMGGFCASTFKRGIDFVQVPTTLLAQVDASIGGKVGVDFQNYKNHIGLFKDPEAVFIYPGFLKTLDKKEKLSGFAEIIKHCLIADRQKWNEILHKGLEDQDWENLIAHSIDIKLSIIKNDPDEKGLRKLLNFGHTIGHALESFYLQPTNPNKQSAVGSRQSTVSSRQSAVNKSSNQQINKSPKNLRHGEAIAIGIVCETFISNQRDMISKDELNSITNYIISTFGKIEIDKTDFENVISITLQDKKNENDKINCTLLVQIGKASFDNFVSKEEIRESLIYYNMIT